MPINWLEYLWTREGFTSSSASEILGSSERTDTKDPNPRDKQHARNDLNRPPDQPPAAQQAIGAPNPGTQGNPTPTAAAGEPQSAAATALAATLTNPVWNPKTPTASDWITWLDGLGQLPQSAFSNNTTVNVGVYRGPTTNYARVRVSAVSDQFLANSQQIFYEMNKFLGISFQVSTISSITATNSSHPLRLFSGKINGYAYAYTPGTGSLNSDMFFNINYDKSGSDTNFFRNGYGSHGWQTIWHETGHALGLDHTFESGTPAAYDNWNYSCMTYTFTGGEAKSWGAGDLAYLQHLYGSNTNYLATDQLYTFSDIDTFSSYYSDGGPGAPTYDTFTNATLYDAGGQDTCDFSALGRGIRYDFDNITGTSSVCYLDDFLKTTYTANNTTQYMTASQTAIAYSTVIEQVIGTDHGDHFLTTAQRSERVDGRAGVDYVHLPGSVNDYTTNGQVDSSGFMEITAGATSDFFKGIEYFTFDSTAVYQISGGAFVLA